MKHFHTCTPTHSARAVDSVYRLRNRVAHLEPVINSNVPAQLTNMRTTIGAIEPRLLSWFSSTEYITTTLQNRPTRP